MTMFPSQRSRDLYAATKGRMSLVDAGLKTPEQVALLDSPRGRRGAWLDRGLGEGLMMISSLGSLFGVGAAVVGTGLMIDGVLLSEAVLAGGGLAAFLGLGIPFLAGLNVWSEFHEATKSTAQEELFKSISEDLDSAGFTFLIADEESMTFSTQKGTVVAGEDKHQDLVLLLNGAPLRASYRAIDSTPTEFITSMDGQKIPMSTAPHFIS